MRAFYCASGTIGLSGTHIWSLTHCDATNRGRWFVSGLGPFTRSGFAVVDDYGTLVEVPR